MSRSTEPRRARGRALAVVVAATALALVPALVATNPAAAATWTISGTIGNWDPSLVGTDVYVVLDDGSSGIDVGMFELSGPSFVWDTADADDPADIVDGQYTLYFDVDDAVEFIDGYLGGRLDEEYPDVTWLDADPQSDVDAGTFDLIEAQYIDGTVIGNGTPLTGIEVLAEDSDIVDAYGGMLWPFEATTDSAGEYRIKVASGRDYVVSVDDPAWLPQTYELQNGCGCGVIPTLVAADPPPAPPATGIDFDLLDPTDATTILGIVADQASDPVDGLEVRLYRASGASWALADVTTSSFTGFSSFEFLLPTPGNAYRVQFIDADGDILEVVDGATSPDLSVFTPFDPVPACYADLGTVTGDLAAFALVDPDSAPGHCASLAASPPSGGGSGPPPRPRTVAVSSAAEVTPTPTPTPTPSATPTPRPSVSPTPTASPAPEPAPASAPDLWWLLWVLLAVAVIAIVGGVLYFARRA